uniref:Uncharacterized protein n=1 Tax=Lotharella globosa TaxID=91324 RepID=A0A7S4DMZ2_9EUKA
MWMKPYVDTWIEPSLWEKPKSSEEDTRREYRVVIPDSGSRAFIRANPIVSSVEAKTTCVHGSIRVSRYISPCAPMHERTFYCMFVCVDADPPSIACVGIFLFPIMRGLDADDQGLVNESDEC